MKSRVQAHKAHNCHSRRSAELSLKMMSACRKRQVVNIYRHHHCRSRTENSDRKNGPFPDFCMYAPRLLPRQTCLNIARTIRSPQRSHTFQRTMASTTANKAKPNGKRIIFTGGSGKAGRHAIPYLVNKGYKVQSFQPSRRGNNAHKHLPYRSSTSISFPSPTTLSACSP